MKIVKLDIDSQEYNELARDFGSVFNLPAWLKMFGKRLNCFGIYDKSNKLVGSYFLYVQKKAGLKYYRNPPFTPSCGLFYKNNASNKSKQMSNEKNIISNVVNYLKENYASIISFSLPNRFIDMQPFFWNNYKVIPHYTYLVDLNDPVEVINANMSPERRNDIKKALKDDVKSVLNYDYSIVEKLVKQTFSAKKKRLDENYINKILFEFANKDNSFSFVSYHNEKPIAVAFCIYDSKTAYYLLGGYDRTRVHQGAGALAVRDSIMHAKEKGLSVFDFEGSMIPAVEKYFRGFGGQMTPYYSANKAPIFIEILLKFIRRAHF